MMRQLTIFAALFVALSVPAIAAEDGKSLYDAHCASCHQKDGTGVTGTFPPLKGNVALKDTDFVAAVLLDGLQAHISVNGTGYQGMMPDWGGRLSNAQIAELLSYVRTQFNNYGKVTEDEVAKVKSSGKNPADLMHKADQSSQSSSGGSGSGGTKTAAASGGSSSETPPKGPSLGNAVMNSAQLTAAMKDIKYDPPFIAEVENLTGEFGEVVKLGYLIFNDTQSYAPQYTKSGLNCRSCHLQVGAQANSAPMWGAFPNYPTYRTKNHLVNSYANRLQGCFMYSMNGIAPPASGEVVEALAAYSAWMSEGLPLGVSPDGRGYPSVKDFKTPDKTRGGKLYAAKCAICHGKDGQGMKVTGGAPGYQFPPLWGPASYNWGAGMHSEKHFRNFIKANMPLGQGNSLSDQEAADIAAFVDQSAHTRPTRIHDPGQAPDF